MGEKYNSGMGGYTCDYCNILLWAGFGGRDIPENRQWIYIPTPRIIVEVEDRVYCSEDCAEEHRKESKND